MSDKTVRIQVRFQSPSQPKVGENTDYFTYQCELDEGCVEAIIQKAAGRATNEWWRLKGEIQQGAENALLQWALTARSSDVAAARAGTDAEVGQ